MKILEFNPDIVHAHYGLSGLLANLQRFVPVVTTYHGSDINERKLRLISWLAIYLSKHNIFVSKKMAEQVSVQDKFSIIPCGADAKVFRPLNKQLCLEKLRLDNSRKYVLFSREFSIAVKNYPLAKLAVEKIPGVVLIELKGFSREEVSLLMNACDVALMTSYTEGSPQFIKEAMLCNTPIVSTDVGDVKEIIGKTEGCYISSYEVNNVVEKINQAISFGRKTDGRNWCIKHYDNEIIALKIIEIYSFVLDNYKTKNHLCNLQ